MKHLSAEDTHLHNLCTAQRAPLQQPGAFVARDSVIGLRRFNQIEEKAVSWIGCLMFARDRIGPDRRAIEVVEHGADLMRLEQTAKLRVAAGQTNFIDLMLAGEYPEFSNSPFVDHLRGQTVG